LIEKGPYVGAHILSGNVFEPKAMNELFPNWKEMENPPPLTTPVTSDHFYLLREDSSISLPHFAMPKSIDNHGNYIISLGNLCDWMKQQAETMGVDILEGIAGDKIIFNDNNSVGGVITGDLGWAKDGTKKDTFTPGIKIKAKQTIFTEGARGSLTERLK
jgi:electron-transferring-flavoprotein dehydrogenase